jgi:signal transduction histidine kinase
VTGGERAKVEICITDNGHGIPSSEISKLFDPFFSTKPVGEGTGLGLSISYDIVKSHGGEMVVDSTENEGTTVRIILPVDAGAKESS